MHNVGATWLMGDLDPRRASSRWCRRPSMLPVFLVGLPAGALADIVDRRMPADRHPTGDARDRRSSSPCSRSPITITSRTLLLLTFVLGLGAALNMPAWQAIQPELVPRSRAPASPRPRQHDVQPRPGDRSRHRRTLIVACGGPGWVFLINALSFLAIVAVLVRWRHRPEPPRAAGRDHRRRDAGRDALWVELDRPPSRARAIGRVRRAGHRVDLAAARRGTRPTRARFRWLRTAPRLLRVRGGVVGAGSTAARSCGSPWIG